MIRLLLFVCHSQPTYLGLPFSMAKCFSIHALVLFLSLSCSFSTFASNNITLLSGNVDAGEDVTVCKGTAVQLEATGTGNFVWSPNNGSLSCTSCANPVATPTTTTEYIVTCDDGVFVTTDTVIVTVLPLPNFNGPITTPPTDCDSNDGEIIIDATEDGVAIEYSINNGLSWQASNIFSNLSGGTYNLKIRNAIDDSCEVDGGDVNFVVANAPVVDDVFVVDPTDCGTLTGTISLTVSGGTTIYEYSHDGGSTWQSGNTFTNLSAGLYPLRVRNFNGTCDISAGTVLLAEPVLPTIEEVIIVSPCNNDNAGSITIVTASHDGVLEYTINGGTNWFSDSIFTGLGAGSYDVAVRLQSPANSCTDTYDLNPIVFDGTRPLPSLDGASPTNSTSCASPNGQITIFVSGGNGSGTYEFSINNGLDWQSFPNSSATFSGLSGGNYQPAVRNDDGSCEVFGAPIALTEPTPPTIDNIAPTNPTDCNATDGTITITASGGSGVPYLFSLNGGMGQNNGVFNNLAAGIYTVEVSNGNGDCITVGNPQTLTEPNAPSIDNIDTTDPTSCATNNGSITITASGGSGTYEYSINDGATYVASNIFNDLMGGDYLVKIRNAADDSCETMGQTVTLATPLSPTIDDIMVTSPNNCENPDGVIVITSNNDPGDFMYSIDGGTTYQVSNTFNNVGGGTYSVAVISTAACETISPNNTILNTPQLPTLDGVSVIQPSGCGTNNGSITIFASGGTLEYSINAGTSWQSSNFFGSLGANNYDIRIRKVGGFCEITAPMEMLTEPNSPSINSVDITDPTDCNISDGTITINATGDNALEYTITGGLSWQSTNSFSSLPGGPYDVRVRYITQTSCETISNTTIELTAPTAPSIQGATSTPLTDCNVMDGTITITASGGDGSYEYSINGGVSWQSSGVFTELAAGNYPVMVRNATQNCEVGGLSVMVDGPNPPVINDVILSNPTGCGLSNGAITIAASGEDALEYSINGGADWQLSNNFPDLSENSYFIRVRYTNMTCMISGMDRALIAPARPDITNIISDNPDCTGTNGRIEIIVNYDGAAPLEYSVNDGASWQFENIFTGLTTGNYPLRVRVSGDGGCEGSGGTPILLEHNPPEITFINFAPPSVCDVNDGFIQIIVSGNNTGGFEFTIDGGMTWQAENGFMGLGSGNYSPAVRPINTECTVFGDPIELIQPDAPMIDNIFAVNPDCDTSDGMITIVASGGSGTFEYTINGGVTWQASNNFNNLPEGNFQVGVRNADASCPTINDNITILVEPDRPLVSMVNSDNPTCDMSNGMIEVIASGGSGNLEYSINGGATWQASNIFNNLGIGTYEVLVRNDEPSCATPAATIQLTEPNAPQMSNINVTDPTNCNTSDGQIQIVASGVGTLEYSINDGVSWQLSPVFNNLSQGTYIIKIRFQDGTCETLGGTVMLVEPLTPVIDVVNVVDPSNCGLSDAVITITTIEDETNYDFSIDGGTTWQSSNIFSGLNAGEYIIAVRNADAAGSCVVLGETIVINANEMPVIVSVDFTDPDCAINNGSITINATSSGMLEYSINNGVDWSTNPVFTNLGENIYRIRVRNINGTCITSTNNVSLNEPAAPNVVNFDATNPDCNGENGSIIITANGGQIPLEYSIDNGLNYQGSNSFMGLAPGTYDIFVRNADDTCPVYGGTTELVVPTPPEVTQITASNSTECSDGSPNGSITISTNDVNVEFSIDGGTTWQFGLVFSNLSGGTYNVLARNFGEICSVSVGIVTIQEPEIPAFSTINSFSPSDCNLADGSIEIIPANGTTLMYSINGGVAYQASNLFNNLDAGTYNIFISNPDGSCARQAGMVSLNAPAQPVIDEINVGNSVCFPNSGTIQIVASGGQGNLEYSIDGGLNWQAFNIFLDLGADTYQPMIRNNDQTCEVSANPVTIIEIDGPQVTDVSFVNPSDCDLSDGSITITATANGQIEYSIDGGSTWQTNGVFSNLNSGTYPISVRNAADGSCEIAGDEVVLSGGDQPIIDEIVTTNPSQCGLDNGVIQISATANNDLEYSINGGADWQSSNTFGNLAGGTYLIAVRSIIGGCETSGGEVSLIAPTVPDITSINVTDVTDCDVNDGEIEIIVAGNADLRYSINNGGTYQASNVFTGLAPGTYNIIVRNSNGSCATPVSTVTVGGIPQPIITELITEDPTACNANDGRILIFINLDRNDFEFSIDGGSTFQASHIFNDLTTGVYDIRIRYLDDTCEVESVSQATLGGENIMITAVNTRNPSTCGVSDGFIDVSLSAIGMYEYSIDNGATWQSMNFYSGLGAGTYSVRVRNVDGSCEVESESVTLVEPNLPTITAILDTNPSSCAVDDGSIEITANGDEALQYSINGGDTYQSGNTFFNLSEGTYLVQVSYLDGGCSVTNDFNIMLATNDQPAVANITNTNPSGCNTNDGSITITATGNTTIEYSIDGGISYQTENTFDNLNGGVYDIFVSYANGACAQAAGTVTLLEPANPSIDNINASNPSACGQSDGSIEVIATGTDVLEYSINGMDWQSSNLFSGLTEGTYNISVRYVGGTCETSAGTPTTLTSPDDLMISMVNTTDAGECGNPGGTITILLASGADNVEYSINNGVTYQVSNTFSGLTIGNYEVTVRVAGTNCESVYTNNPVIVSGGNGVVISNVVADTPTDCDLIDGMITIFADCQVPAPDCILEYSINGGDSYQASNIFNGLNSGNYNVIVRKTDGTCEMMWGEVTIVSPTPPTISDVIYEHPTDCGLPNGTITVIATGENALEYSINDGIDWQSSNMFTELSEGTYTILVRNATGGCEVAYEQMIVLESCCLIRFVLEQLNDGTYQVSMIPDTTLTEPDNATMSMRVTLVVPADGFTLANMMSSNPLIAFSVNTINEPIQNPTADYINFTLAMTTMAIPYNQGVVVPLFTFENVDLCADHGETVSIMHNLTDPFQSSMVGNLVSILGIAPEDMTICTFGTDTAPIYSVLQDVTVLQPSDCGEADGSITIVTDCSIADCPYEYSIDGGVTFVTDSIFNDLSAGIYNVVVRNTAENCDVNFGDNPIQLGTGEEPTITNVITTNPTTCAGTNGMLQIIATGNNLEYSINDGTTYQSSNLFQNLSAGMYIIRVRANGDCAVPYSLNPVLINEGMDGQPVISEVTPTPPTTCDSADGSIVITATGTGDLEYSIDGGVIWQASNTFMGLTDGSYNVAVRNATDGTCEVSFIENPVILEAINGAALPEITNIEISHPSCSNVDGSLVVTAEACGDIEYSLDGINWQSSNAFGPLTGGAYTVRVRSVNDNDLIATQSAILSTPLICIDTIFITIPNDSTVICIDSVLDVPNGPGSVTICEEGSQTTTVLVQEESCLSLIPDDNFMGMDTICIVTCDFVDPTLCDTTIIVVTVEETILHPDTTYVTIPNDMTSTECITQFIDTPNGIGMTSICDNPDDINTSLNLMNGEVCVSLQPINGFLGTDTVCIVVCDLFLPNLCDTTIMIVTVIEDNLPPLPDTLYETTLINTPIEVCLDEYILPAENVVLTACGDPTDGSMTFNGACLTYDPDFNYLGMDTMCVSVCDAADPMNCDTVYVIITVEPDDNLVPLPDTIYETTELETPIEICLDELYVLNAENVILTSCGEPMDGSLTFDGACLTYTPDMDFLGLDTMCVSICDMNDPTNCDTTIVIINVISDVDCEQDIFEETSLTFPTNETEICVPIPFSESAIYDITIDGEPYILPLESCASDTFVSYFYGLTPGQLAAGPYNVETWLVNDTAYAGLINDALGLQNFMNFWDEDGHWVIDPVTFNIFGGDLVSQYDSLVIRQDATGETITLLPMVTALEGGFTVTVTGTGTHTLVIQNTNTGCTDEINIVLEGSDVLTGDTIRLVTDFETPTDPICLDTMSLGGDLISQTLCDTPSNGIVDSVAANCFIYTPNNGFIGLDTFCVELCFGSPLSPICDTTIVIIDVLAPDCGVFASDEINLVTDDCDAPASLCLDVNLSEFITYTITDNGTPYENGIAGCAFDTMFRYAYVTVPDLGAVGPYSVDSWTVNGTIFSGAFANIGELVDSMNVWDPTGDWTADGITFAIIGGNPANTYGTMVITQTATGAIGVLMSSLEAVATGTMINLTVGTHQLVLTNNVSGCTDLALVTVTCPMDTMTGIFQDTTINIITHVGQPETICLDEVLGINAGDITSITNVCEDQGTGNVNFVLDTMTSCILLESLTIGMDTACFEVCIGMDSCVVVTINVEVLDVCEDFIPIEVVGSGVDCQSQDTVLCIPIPLSQIMNYSIETDGQPYTGTIKACNLDSMFTYSYFSLLELGDGPFNVDEWRVNQDTFMGEFANVIDLVDSLNVWDPSTNWTFDESTLTIRGASPSNTYGPIVITEIASGGMAALILNALLVPLGTGLELSLGTHEIVFTNMETGCRDTIIGTISCMTTETIYDTINVADVQQICLDTLELQGNFVSISNACPELSGESVVFTIDSETLCVTYEGFEPGTETACIILCDDLGVCDTTFIIVTVLETDDGLDAVDDLGTTTPGGTVVIDVFANDIIPNNMLDTFYIVIPPSLGTVFFDNDGLVTYMHNGDTCDVVDNFTYAICNATACDTAMVTIDIPCDTLISGEFEIFPGFSPNGDGVNETFMIIGLDEFPNNQLRIFNRWGNLVYQANGYQNDWKGTWKDKDLPDGTYFYLLDLGTGDKPLSGYLVIRR